MSGPLAGHQATQRRAPSDTVFSRLGGRVSVPGVLPLALVVAYLCVVPLVVVVWASFHLVGPGLTRAGGGFSTDNYTTIFGSPLIYRLLLNTIWYAGGSVGLALALTLLFAWLIERCNVPLRSLALAAVLAPLATPRIVEAIAWIFLANPSNGILNVLLRALFGFPDGGPMNIYGVWGMIFVTGTSLVPGMYLMLSGVLSRFDPVLEDAGAVAGAGRVSTLKRVTLPLLLPAVLMTAVYHFIISVEAFEVPALFGMSQGTFVFSTLIYDAARPGSGLPRYGEASAYAVLLMMLAGLLMLVYGRAVTRTERFAVVTGRGYQPRLVDLRGWRFVALGLLLVYFLVVVVLPILTILWVSLLPFYAGPQLDQLTRLTLDNYASVVSGRRFGDAVRLTAGLGVFTATTACLLGAATSRAAVRPRSRLSALPDRLSFATVATPSVVLGLALLVLYIGLPLPIYGTWIVIALALLTRFLPATVRIIGPAYMQIHTEIEDAAALSGATPFSTHLRVVFPLIGPTLLRAWLWVFVHAVKETTLVLMLASVGSETLSTLLWFSWREGGNYGRAAAVAVMLVAASSVLTLAVGRMVLVRHQA